MAFWEKVLRKTPQADWHDDVVTVAILAREAGIGGSLHDMVINTYYRGVAVPRNESEWRPSALRSELKRIASEGDSALAKLARAALKKLP